MRPLLSLAPTLSLATSCAADSNNSLPDAAGAAFDNAAPFLKVRAIRHIAGILIGHPHRDHLS